MSLMTIPWTLSKRLWARARARGEPSYFIVFSKNARCSSVRGCTYLTIGTSSWGVQSKAKVYIVLDMGRYYTKKLLGGRLTARIASVFSRSTTVSPFTQRLSRRGTSSPGVSERHRAGPWEVSPSAMRRCARTIAPPERSSSSDAGAHASAVVAVKVCVKQGTSRTLWEPRHLHSRLRPTRFYSSHTKFLCPWNIARECELSY